MEGKGKIGERRKGEDLGMGREGKGRKGSIDTQNKILRLHH
jgi:hypothetical protein